MIHSVFKLKIDINGIYFLKVQSGAKVRKIGKYWSMPTNMTAIGHFMDDF